MSNRQRLATVFAIVHTFLAVNAEEVATCTESLPFLNNARNQTPCQVAPIVLESCAGSSYSIVPKLEGPDDIYQPPTGNDATLCSCHSITYSLLSACAACQDRGFIDYTEWTENCSFVSEMTDPNALAVDGNRTEIPPWAKTQVDGSTFDLYSVPGAPPRPSKHNTSLIVALCILIPAVMISIAAAIYFTWRYRRFVGKTYKFLEAARSHKLQNKLRTDASADEETYSTVLDIKRPTPTTPISLPFSARSWKSLTTRATRGSRSSRGRPDSPSASEGLLTSPQNLGPPTSSPHDRLRSEVSIIEEEEVVDYDNNLQSPQALYVPPQVIVSPPSTLPLEVLPKHDDQQGERHFRNPFWVPNILRGSAGAPLPRLPSNAPTMLFPASVRAAGYTGVPPGSHP